MVGNITRMHVALFCVQGQWFFTVHQIFFVSEIVSVPSKSLEEASPEIERQIYNEIVDDKFLSWLKELRERSHIKIIK